MFVLGHMGIGSKLVQPLAGRSNHRAGLPRRWLLLGTILPDLIDKSIYYGLSFFSPASPLLDWIRGTRSFGHTALFALALALYAFLRKSKIAAALSLGVVSHLILDSISDQLSPVPEEEGVTGPSALLWPFTGMLFPSAIHAGLRQHLGILGRPVIWITELLGAGILIWDYWKSSHRSELLKRLKFIGPK